jgi:hypothetical protein
VRVEKAPLFALLCVARLTTDIPILHLTDGLLRFHLPLMVFPPHINLLTLKEVPQTEMLGLEVLIFAGTTSVTPLCSAPLSGTVMSSHCLREIQQLSKHSY